MKTLIFTLVFIFTHSINTQAQSPIITPCAQLTEMHVVVIGSSTAAGTGPSTPDSTWVNRYRKYLQTINPQNQVTNLAIGGTTTYHIMPNWFVPSAGKPATNPNNNVTQAINLGADAIIVNMPSNDASNGFGLNEQMSNFITIANTADSMNIPVWICTTQPRSFNPAKKAIQISVRDSILSYFGAFAVDFWTGIADSNDVILSQYDSGDGVHLNNDGHEILINRIINKNIPNFLADTAATTDHLITSLYLDNTPICGDSNSILSVVVGNIGPSSSQTIDVVFSITDQVSASTNNQNISLTTPLATCSSDTVHFALNTYNGVHYNLQAFLNNLDLNKSNDTSSTLALFTQGHPSIFSANDTICVGDSSVLTAWGNAPLDTVIWYDAPTAGNIVAFGNNLVLNNVLSSQTYYSEVVRGNLYFDESLATSTTTTTNWNGVMFDIVALDTITIDSLSTKLNTLGLQTVIAYYRTGSHAGYEMTPGAWTLWGNATTQVNTVGEFKTLDYPDRVLYPNDTLAVYLHLQNGGANLSYLSSGNALVYTNHELQILGGSGVSHTFGTIYTPRNWSGEVFYHHGFNPLGNCNTTRVPVQAIVAQPSLDLGNDTTLYSNQSILLNNNTNFSSYAWSDNSTSSQLLIDSSNTAMGANTIWLTTTDAYGCLASDTIIVTFTVNTDFNSIFQEASIQLFPNPSQGKIYIKSNENLESKVVVFNASGQEIRRHRYSKQQEIDLSDLPKGVYWIQFHQDNRQLTKKLVLY